MTKRTWIIVAVALVAHLAYADTLVDVYVNGEKQDFAPAARVREGTTYAPLRAVADSGAADGRSTERESLLGWTAKSCNDCYSVCRTATIDDVGQNC